MSNNNEVTMPRRGENIYKLRDCRWKGRILSDNGYHSVSIHGYYEVKQKLRNYPGTTKATTSEKISVLFFGIIEPFVVFSIIYIIPKITMF